MDTYDKQTNKIQLQQTQQDKQSTCAALAETLGAGPSAWPSVLRFLWDAPEAPAPSVGNGGNRGINPPICACGIGVSFDFCFVHTQITELNEQMTIK
jgi:hypothetical protein